jgi:cytochrome P450
MLPVLIAALALVLLVAFVFVRAARASHKFYRVKGSGKHHMNGTGALSIFNIFKSVKESRSHDMFEEYMTYGYEDGIYQTFMGPFTQVKVVDPDAIKKIVLDTTTFPKHPMLINQNPSSLLAKFQGKNIVFTEGQDWKSQRHVVNPAFYNIEIFYPLFFDLTNKLMDRWASIVDKNNGPTSITVMPEMTNFTIDALGSAVFGIDFDAINGNLSHIVESYDFLMGAIQQVSRLIFPFINKLPTQYNRQMEHHLKQYDDMIYKLIEEARSRKEDSEKAKTLLDMMIQSEEGIFDNKILRDNCSVFFVAGHETTASALGFALYTIAKDQRVQDKIVAEIEQVTGMKESPTYEQINSMEYLSCVIKEYMRLYPSIGSIPMKMAAKDTELCGYFIPKGTMITMDTYSLHHSEKVYGPTVEEFRPERWQREEAKSIHKFAYMPFSAGQRVCVGNNFSLLEQKIFLVRLLQRFSISLEKGYKLSFNKEHIAVNHPEKSFAVVVTPRS